ncbi:MAG: hypothetical protein IKO68_10360 [Oscillospiraceae bacterium]|nr:hypothetical protein [Oscillospiraceae bacterium]
MQKNLLKYAILAEIQAVSVDFQREILYNGKTVQGDRERDKRLEEQSMEP